jgi:hypothetical protein
VRDWTYIVQKQGVLAVSEVISDEFYILKDKEYIDYLNDS